MLRCCECGRIFDEPVREEEYSEYWGVPGWTGYYVSPCCREAFEEYDGDEELERYIPYEPEEREEQYAF